MAVFGLVGSLGHVGDGFGVFALGDVYVGVGCLEVGIEVGRGHAVDVVALEGGHGIVVLTNLGVGYGFPDFALVGWSLAFVFATQVVEEFYGFALVVVHNLCFAHEQVGLGHVGVKLLFGSEAFVLGCLVALGLWFGCYGVQLNQLGALFKGCLHVGLGCRSGLRVREFVDWQHVAIVIFIPIANRLNARIEGFGGIEVDIVVRREALIATAKSGIFFVGAAREQSHQG